MITNSPYENHNLTIRTSFDPFIDKITTKKVNDFNDIYCDKSVVIINKNGNIVSYFSTCGDVYRQMGSTIKPLAVYAPAIEKNIVNSYTILKDEKSNFLDYSPSNFNDKYYGDISVKNSLAISSNVCAVKLLNYLGVKNSVNYIKNLNIPITEQDNSLALALGATEKGAKLTQITNAYNVFLNEGYLPQVSCLNGTIKNGVQLPKNFSKTKPKVFNDDTITVMNDMLKNVVMQGTAKKLNFANIDIYAKTGTVGNKNGNTDAYCISYNADYVIGVWFGAKSNCILENTITGGGYTTTLACEIWKEIYKNKQAPPPIKNSENIVETYIEKDTYENNKEVVLSNENTFGRNNIKAIFTQKAYQSIKSKSKFIPRVDDYKISVNDYGINIELCLAQNSFALVYKVNKKTKSLLFDTADVGCSFTDINVKPQSVYQYIIIPYYKVNSEKIYGKEIKTKKIKTPSKMLGEKWWVDDFD